MGPRHSTRKRGRPAVRAGPSQHACAGTRQTRCCAHGRSGAALLMGHVGVVVAVGQSRCCCATAVTTFENPLLKRWRRALRLRRSLSAAFFGGWADRLVRPCGAHVCVPCLRSVTKISVKFASSKTMGETDGTNVPLFTAWVSAWVSSDAARMVRGVWLSCVRGCLGRKSGRKWRLPIPIVASCPVDVSNCGSLRRPTQPSSSPR